MRRTAALFCLVLISVSGRASDAPADRETLRGIKSIKVAVDPPGPELNSEGLRAADLQARIEARLSKASIAMEPAAREFLGLHLIAVQETKGAFGICLALGVYQGVLLDRDHNIRTAVPTWETQSIVVVRPKQVREAIDNTLDQLVDQFIRAYETANPK